jgi:Protein of unknown function (DUF2961)/HEAT repeats
MRRTRALGLLLGFLSAAPAAVAQPAITGPVDPLAFTQLKDFRAYRSSSNSRYPDWNDDSAHLYPGETLTLADLEGPGIVTHIWTTSSGSQYGWPRLLRIRAYYDGGDVASVDAPLGDFFAVGHGLERSVNSLLIRDGSDGRARNSYWPMPFRRRCRITVTNEGDRFTGLYYHVDWQKMPSLPPGTAYFHARYRQLLPAPADGKPFVFLETKGRGFYAGTVQNILQAEPGWYGEGDDMFYVDGEKTASIQGTGSEDYFLDAWGLHVADGAYAGVTVADGTGLGSRMTAYRWHMTDPVPFTSSIRVEIEHKGWTYKPDGTVRTAFGERQDVMSSVAYWYQEGIATDQPPVPYGRARLPHGNALQIELEESFSSARLDGGKASVMENLFWGKDVILFDAAGPGSRIEAPFEVPEDGEYETIVQVAQASGYGNYEIWLDGKPPAPPALEHEPGADIRTDAQYDGYAWETYVGKTVALGWLPLTKGRHTLTFVCTGKRSESTGFKAGIDNVILARVGAAAWAKAGDAKPPGFRRGTVPSLAAQLGDRDPVVRTLAACALRDEGAVALPALDALVARLKDPEMYVRAAAAEAIGAIGPKAAPAVPALTAACKVSGEDPLPLRQYAYALGDIGPASRPALPTLEAMKADRRVEWVVVKAIAEIEGTRPGRKTTAD